MEFLTFVKSLGGFHDVKCEEGIHVVMGVMAVQIST